MEIVKLRKLGVLEMCVERGDFWLSVRFEVWGRRGSVFLYWFLVFGFKMLVNFEGKVGRRIGLRGE